MSSAHFLKHRRDLFGGDEVEVVPSNPQWTYASPVPPSSYRMGRMPKRGSGGTIELVVRLASILIKCHGTFDIYPKPLVGDCEPLIQLHTTTTETIHLHEVRVGDDGVSVSDKNGNGVGGENGGSGENGSAPTPTPTPTVLMLKEKMTETRGQRILSIRPARYERVDDWHTPS